MTAQETKLLNAFETTLTGTIGASDTTLTVNSVTDSASNTLTASCYLVINPDSATNREVILVTGVNSGTKTLDVSSVGNRYLTGSAATSGLSHASGSVVRMSPLQQHIEDLNDRVDTVINEAGTAVNTTLFLDEDDMTSNSATKGVTQQSVKAYVDTQLTAEDLDISADSGSNIAIDLDSEVLDLEGGTGIDTTTGTNKVTFAIDSTVAPLTGSQTLTNKTIDVDSNTVSNIEVDNLKSGVLDTDLSSTAGTDTTLPSAKAVKTYVDAQVTAQDLDTAGNSGTGAVDLDSQSLTVSGDGTILTSTASGQGITFAIADATTSAKGAASFSSDNFAVSSGAVTIKDGGVVNAELANSSVNYGGVSLSLGGSDTTPAFNLVDSTGYTAAAITGTIGNSQVGTGIDAIKLADGTVTNAELQYINSLTSNAQTQLGTKLTASNNLSDIGTAATARTNLGLGTIATQASSSVAVTGGSITGIGSPSNNSDVAIKSYVDDAVAGLRTRIIAEAATTANVSLTNGLEAGDSIDGVTLVAGDRVLVKDQSTATENGLYLAVASGAASRDPEHDTIAELSGGTIVVNQGTVNDNKIFLCTTDSTGSIGSTNITYTVVTPSNTGTVTSVGLTQSGTEFTIGSTPITSSGNITINVNRISATKIGGGTTVSDTEYGYLANVSSDIQTQLDAKSTAGFSVAMAIAL